MVLIEILEEVSSYGLPCSFGGFSPQCISNVIEVFFQCILTKCNLEELNKPADNIILKVFIIGNGQDIIHVRYKSSIYPCILNNYTFFILYNLSYFPLPVLILPLFFKIPTGINKAFCINGISAKHTTHCV